DRLMFGERRAFASELADVAETGLVRRARLADGRGALAVAWARAHALADEDDEAARAQVARLAAEALDDACGELFAEGFRRRGRRGGPRARAPAAPPRRRSRPRRSRPIWCACSARTSSRTRRRAATTTSIARRGSRSRPTPAGSRSRSASRTSTSWRRPRPTR